MCYRQICLATEAAGEGINLQFCRLTIDYDIPWNPNRLEQRMGRIHRIGQPNDVYIFNFVATNTVEGRVLEKLLSKLEGLSRIWFQTIQRIKSPINRGALHTLDTNQLLL